MEKLNRAQKCSILGPQNLGSRGGLGPQGPSGSAPGFCFLNAVRKCILHDFYKFYTMSTIQQIITEHLIHNFENTLIGMEEMLINLYMKQQNFLMTEILQLTLLI